MAPEVISVCPGNSWSSEVSVVALDELWTWGIFRSTGAVLSHRKPGCVWGHTQLSKWNQGPWGSSCQQPMPDLLTVLESKVSFVCFLVSCMFFLANIVRHSIPSKCQGLSSVIGKWEMEFVRANCFCNHFSLPISNVLIWFWKIERDWSILWRRKQKALSLSLFLPPPPQAKWQWYRQAFYMLYVARSSFKEHSRIHCLFSRRSRKGLCLQGGYIGRKPMVHKWDLCRNQFGEGRYRQEAVILKSARKWKGTEGHTLIIFLKS